MAKYTARFKTTATATITLDVPDHVAAYGAEAIQHWISTNAPAFPTLCGTCSGWGKDFALDLDGFEPTEHETGPHQGLAYVTDANGQPVTD